MLATNPAFRIYAICTCILVINLMVLAGLTGAWRGKHKSLLNPEDAGFDPKKDHEHPAVLRVFRAHRNAVENILPFIGVGLVYSLSNVTERSAMIYFGTFTVARLLHTAFYLAGKQPWRTIAFAVGTLALLGMCFQVLMRAFAAS